MTINAQKEPLIIPEQLRAAREDIALSIEEVARRLEVEPDKLNDWERGNSEPSLEQLWDLAEVYSRSIDYFLKHTEPIPAGLSFRLARRELISDLPLEARNALVRFDELCRAESELESLLGKQREIRVKRYGPGLSPEKLAQTEKHRLGLDERPIKNLRGVLFDQGVRIFLVPVDGNVFAGLSWWHKIYGPCILINALDPAGRRNFTLAHEYAHLLRSDPPTLCDLDVDVEEERFATRFAVHFLMPGGDVQKTCLKEVGPPGTLPTVPQLGKLAGRYGVGSEAMGRRLEDLGLVPRGTVDERIDEWRRWRPDFLRGRKGPKWRQRLGDRYVHLVLQAHSEGHISLGKLARYLELDVWQAHDILEKERAAKSVEGE